MNRRFAKLPAWQAGLALMHAKASSDIVAEVIVERVQQDVQWGGPEADDSRTPQQWLGYIERQLRKVAHPTEQPTPANFRERMVKVAALALAALQADARKNPVPCDCQYCAFVRQVEDLFPGATIHHVRSMEDLENLAAGLSACEGAPPDAGKVN